MNNLSSYCEIVDAKIRASDKDLPVQPPSAVPKVVLLMVIVLPDLVFVVLSRKFI